MNMPRKNKRFLNFNAAAKFNVFHICSHNNFMQ